MDERVALRLADIKRAITNVRDLLAGRSFDQVERDIFRRAAFERFVEIVSEASRHLPAHLKDGQDHLPWRHIADVGNILRHAYHRSDLRILWDVYERDLDPLEAAVDAMIADVSAKS